MGLFSNRNKHDHEIQPCCGPIVIQFGGDSSFKNQRENELVQHFLKLVPILSAIDIYWILCAGQPDIICSSIWMDLKKCVHDLRTFFYAH